jgi:NAD-dependent dihydropyrimidine dehydrogenase PreA subunit
MTGSGENRRLNTEKAKRAAQHPERPGEKCAADPDFLYAAPDTTACAAFIKESRMNFANANQLHRKFGEAGAYRPVVNRNACEGKSDCVEVCPYDVFEVRQIDDEDFSSLSFLGKLKSRAHGRLTAYTPHADLCQACGLCVVACPEKAITLVTNKHL